MGCTSSKYMPWVGRNEITQAAKHRKKAAKEALESFKAYSGCHASRIASLKIFAQSLSVFLDEEDRALFSGDISSAPAPPPPGSAPYQASWVSDPKSLESVPEAKASAQEGPGNEEKPPLEKEKEQETQDERASEPTSLAVQAYVAPPSLAVVTYAGHSGVSGALTVAEGSRGAGLSQLGKTIVQLCDQVQLVCLPASDVLAVGVPKKYTALPPLPTYVQGTYPGTPTEKLWDVLEILVAYEKARCKEIKTMEKVKWEYNRTSKKLAKQSRKQVPPEKSQKQQKRIQSTHSKVQQSQATLARLGNESENLSRALLTIKGSMLYPALHRTLADLLLQHNNVCSVYDQLHQVAVQATEGGKLSGRHVAGPGVLFTQPPHHSDTKALEASLTKLDQSFSEEIKAERKFLNAVVEWIKKVDPVGSTSVIPPTGPGTPPSAPTSYSYPVPAQSQSYPQAQPHANQWDSVQQFLDGSISGGDPLLALCSDWARALDKCPLQGVKDSVLLYSSWVKEAIVRQSEETKQAKALKDAQAAVEKAGKKLDTAIAKEKQARTGLQVSPSFALALPSTSDSQDGLPLPTPDPVIGNKSDARALAKEQSREVKAFQLAKTVDLEKAVLESARSKAEEEQKSLEAMALTSRVTATNGLEQALPGVFKSMSVYSVVTVQMYGMLQGQHGGMVQIPPPTSQSQSWQAPSTPTIAPGAPTPPLAG